MKKRSIRFGLMGLLGLFALLTGCDTDYTEESTVNSAETVTPSLSYPVENVNSDATYQFLLFRNQTCEMAQQSSTSSELPAFTLYQEFDYSFCAAVLPNSENLILSRPEPKQYESLRTDYFALKDRNGIIPDIWVGCAAGTEIRGSELPVTLSHAGAIFKATLHADDDAELVDSILLTIKNMYDRVSVEGIFGNSTDFDSKTIVLRRNGDTFTNTTSADTLVFPTDKEAEQLSLTYIVCYANGKTVRKSTTHPIRIKSGKRYTLSGELLWVEAVSISTKISYQPWEQTVIDAGEIVLPDPRMAQVYVTTDSGEGIYSKEEYMNGAVRIVGWGNYPTFEGRMRIRGRGNTSWFFPKKPYRMKLDEKASLLGLPKNKDWLLISDYTDPTLLLNSIAYETANYLGLKYTNHTRFVELFINGKYRGVYRFTEQVEVATSRVDIDKKKGFLVELDDYYDSEGEQFRSDWLYLPVMVKSPDITQDSDMNFIRDAIREMENRIKPNVVANGSYRDVVNSASLINYLLVNEICGNGEINHPKSVYLYKDINSKIEFGPVWDFDWGFGYTGNGTEYFKGQSWIVNPNATSVSDWSEGYYFFTAFFKDPTFKAEYVARWNEIKTGVLAHLLNHIAVERAQLNDYMPANFERWEQSCNFNQEVDRLVEWLQERIAFLDSRINSL